MGRDELGDSCEFGFFFLGVSTKGDCNVWVWGISSSIASEFECGARVLFFVWSSVNGSPVTSIRGSFFVENAKSTLDGCRSFEDVMLFFCVSESPLQGLKIEIDSDDIRFFTVVVRISDVVSCS